MCACVHIGVQLARHNKEMSDQLRPTQRDIRGELQTDLALEYYSQHTGQIEVVRSDRTMEQIVFPIPEICEYLTEETKHRVFVTAERDDQNSKVTDFFHQHEKLFTEMLWQKKLRGHFCRFVISYAIDHLRVCLFFFV